MISDKPDVSLLKTCCYVICRPRGTERTNDGLEICLLVLASLKHDLDN